jgi:hypothetical protein
MRLFFFFGSWTVRSLSVRVILSTFPHHVEDPGVNGRIILKLVFEKWDGGGVHGLDRSGSVQGQVAGCCECGNEPSGSIKCGKFLH